jgi:hypothetical protein
METFIILIVAGLIVWLAPEKVTLVIAKVGGVSFLVAVVFKKTADYLVKRLG